MEIVKKDGSIVEFDGSKIAVAIGKSAERIGANLHPDVTSRIVRRVEAEIGERATINQIHALVCEALDYFAPRVADSYREYRDYKTSFVGSFDKLYEKTKAVLYLGDKENANFDSALVSTKGSLIRGYLTTELYKKFHVNKEESQAMNDGFVYMHDTRDLIFGSFNCCLFDMANVLRGGFEMANVKYSEPKTVLSALQVIGDLTLVATAQQFGGFTISDIDKVLVPYVRKSASKYWDDAETFGIPESHAAEYVNTKVKEELRQGFQSLELKLNTVPCSRGDFAFTTLSFGCCDVPEDASIQQMICHTILDTRMKGHGGEPVVFPKLVYLHSEKQHKTVTGQSELFDHCIQCSSKVMYPDYLSIDGEGDVSRIYGDHGVVTSPMGCRAFLSEWIDPTTRKAITTGRANIGAVTLNLPMIWQQSAGKEFYQDLEKYLQMCRRFLQKRYAAVSQSKASANPLAFTQGGLYGGTLKPNDDVGNLVDYMTASFGITSLHELSMLATGKGMAEDSKFANEVVDFIQSRVAEFKAEDGHLYALYGVPAESVASTQAKQFRRMFGVIDGVSDRDYFTNSFHCHVSEDITPFEKQDKEEQLFHKINGGHIQYVRIDNPNNTDAIAAVVKRGMRKGFYQGVNFDSGFCRDCGKHSTNSFEKCGECGSTNVLVMSRVCGYLGYSNVFGNTRMNDGKMAEIRDRKSM